MAKCEICEKATVFGNNVSHSERKTSRTFKPNIRKVKIDDNGTVRKANICTSCLRSDKVKRA
ncbi:MAG: 50S ribosomal protein L28 [Clostridia bacterium]|jgi:large subunit ribosomal protein L28|nr:50S ribosomal protein L28 [Clostridia bacterium]NLV33669.1 50S ribosomal protein L28 [Clostridiaceae bacterium]OQB53385.1 MAG: 50S ribosomal protein L28 [Firmicutes bacterium ADurb.Bin146]HOD92412.1 50S ribosomal protein L28 [Clostridia bacterium]HPB17253.1 50S ribosomal protein L28 [Clostridia bacterium]